MTANGPPMACTISYSVWSSGHAILACPGQQPANAQPGDLISQASGLTSQGFAGYRHFRTAAGHSELNGAQAVGCRALANHSPHQSAIATATRRTRCFTVISRASHEPCRTALADHPNPETSSRPTMIKDVTGRELILFKSSRAYGAREMRGHPTIRGNDFMSGDDPHRTSDTKVPENVAATTPLSETHR